MVQGFLGGHRFCPYYVPGNPINPIITLRESLSLDLAKAQGLLDRAFGSSVLHETSLNMGKHLLTAAVQVGTEVKP